LKRPTRPFTAKIINSLAPSNNQIHLSHPPTAAQIVTDQCAISILQGSNPHLPAKAPKKQKKLLDALELLKKEKLKDKRGISSLCHLSQVEGGLDGD
jgi:hypothetical protein